MRDSLLFVVVPTIAVVAGSSRLAGCGVREMGCDQAKEKAVTQFLLLKG